MSIYNLDLDREYSNVPSHQSPTVIIHDAPLPMHLEEVHSSPVMEKIPSERHSMIQEDHPSNYNIEEIFDVFTFNLCRKEVIWKRVQNVKHNDGTMKKVKEDEVMFERTYEDPMIVATTSMYLTQDTSHNVTMLNGKLLQTKSDNIKLKDEIIS